MMDIETYNRRERMLKLREELLSVEEARAHGEKYFSPEEVVGLMEAAITEAEHGIK